MHTFLFTFLLNFWFAGGGAGMQLSTKPYNAMKITLYQIQYSVHMHKLPVFDWHIG